jgi:hypothetical protein
MKINRRMRHQNNSHPVLKAFGSAMLLVVAAGLLWGWEDLVRYMKIRSM